jgi:hypothetical protein
MHTRTSETNVFITLRKLYIETGDILICLLCVRLMAALVRLGEEKQDKMLGYFLSFSVRLYLFFSFPSTGQFILLHRHRVRILERNVNNCSCAKIWTCQTEVRSIVARSLVKPAPLLRISLHA